MALSERPTADLVMLIVTLLVASCILLTGTGLFVLATVHPDYPLASALATFSETIAVMIGAVLGYLAGRGRSPQSREE